MREWLEALADGSFQLSGSIGLGRQQPVELQSFEIGETVRMKDKYILGHVRMSASVCALAVTTQLASHQRAGCTNVLHPHDQDITNE